MASVRCQEELIGEGDKQPRRKDELPENRLGKTWRAWTLSGVPERGPFLFILLPSVNSGCCLVNSTGCSYLNNTPPPAPSQPYLTSLGSESKWNGGSSRNVGATLISSMAPVMTVGLDKVI